MIAIKKGLFLAFLIILSSCNNDKNLDNIILIGMDAISKASEEHHKKWNSNTVTDSIPNENKGKMFIYYSDLAQDIKGWNSLNNIGSERTIDYTTFSPVEKYEDKDRMSDTIINYIKKEVRDTSHFYCNDYNDFRNFLNSNNEYYYHFMYPLYYSKLLKKYMLITQFETHQFTMVIIEEDTYNANVSFHLDYITHSYNIEYEK